MPKATHYRKLSTLLSVLHHFQHSLMTFAGAAPNMNQEQEAVPEQTTASPAVQVYRRSQEISQQTCRSADHDLNPFNLTPTSIAS